MEAGVLNPRRMRFTFRQLAKSPGFTIVSVLTIALGVGANTAIFSIMNAVLLRFLPVSHPEQLVFFHLRNQPLSSSQSGYGDFSLSMPVYQAMRGQKDVLSAVIACAPLSFDKVPVRVGAEPEEVYGELVSGNFFSALGVQPLVGRGFTDQDESHHAAVAIVSYGWWNRRFAAAPDILDRTFYVKGIAFRIVGVAPPGFRGTDPGQTATDFWIPLQQRPELNPWGTPAADHTLYGSPEWLALLLIGRLRPGVTPQQAEARLDGRFRSALAQASPVSPKEQPPQLFFTPLRGIETLRDDYEQPLRILMAMAALILIIACANVAMLLIARNASRRREFGLRQALGAGRRALFLQLLAEATVLVTAGATLGWLFAGAGTEALTAWSGMDTFVDADRRVLLFTLCVSAAVALLFGLAPLRVSSRVPLNLALRSATAGMDRSRLWGRKAVIATQIALCTVLLFAAGLLYRTLRNLESRELGMRTAGLLVFGVTPQTNIHSDADAVRFHTTLLDRMRALPGVDRATVMQVRIGSGGANNDGAVVDGRNPMPARPFAPMRTNVAGPDFLRTLGIPLLRGRDIAESDTAQSQKVVVIDQFFADRYLPGTDPIGHHVAFLQGRTNYTIVGVAGNSRYQSAAEKGRPTAYFPFTQVSGILGMQYELHAAGDPRLLIPEASRLARRMDPNLPLERPVTQREQFARSITEQRLIANLAIFFGGLAAFLIAIGLYATVSYSVARRTAEIGVRMALGAQRGEVLRMVLAENLQVAAVGVAIGIPAALAASRALRSMLYGLGTSDPLALILAIAVIAAVGFTAAALPARRAASTDPIRALRME